jgi:hypothetical protein
MNPRHYHTPITPATTRVRCPVCHETVYSRAGIHPQCAVKQSEPPRPKPPKPTDPAALVDDPTALIPELCEDETPVVV